MVHQQPPLAQHTHPLYAGWLVQHGIPKTRDASGFVTFIPCIDPILYVKHVKVPVYFYIFFYCGISFICTDYMYPNELIFMIRT